MFASLGVMTTWIGSVPEKALLITVSGMACPVIRDVRNALLGEPHIALTL